MFEQAKYCFEIVTNKKANLNDVKFAFYKL